MHGGFILWCSHFIGIVTLCISFIVYASGSYPLLWILLKTT